MTEFSTPQDTRELVHAYQTAQSRLLMFDHDGVLSPLKDDISAAASAPDPSTLQSLQRLAETPNTYVYVVSGRAKEALDSWYGAVPAIGLSAEHGAWRKQNGEWQLRIERFDKLKERIVTALKPFTQRAPGTHIETKDFSVVWHFRTAENEHEALAAIPDIEATLGEIVKGSDLAVYTSAVTGKIIEIKPKNINKGAVALSLIEQYNTPDFIFAIGDDYTDEHAFAACPPGSWTVKVGAGQTAARLRVPDVPAVTDLLQQLADH